MAVQEVRTGASGPRRPQTAGSYKLDETSIGAWFGQALLTWLQAAPSLQTSSLVFAHGERCSSHCRSAVFVTRNFKASMGAKMPPAQGGIHILGTMCGRRPQKPCTLRDREPDHPGCTRFLHLHCRIETMYCRSVVFQTRNFKASVGAKKPPAQGGIQILGTLQESLISLPAPGLCIGSDAARSGRCTNP